MLARKAMGRSFTAAIILAAGAMSGSIGLWACGGDDDNKGAGGGPGDGGDATTSADGDPSGEGGPGGDAGPPPTAKEACEAYFRAACGRREECGMGPSESCERLMAYCPDYYFASGSTRTVEGMIACAEARRTQPCDEVIRGIDPPCATPGTRAGGEPCHFSGQCASQRCSTTAGCGTCLVLKAPDSGCPNFGETCGVNRECNDPQEGCVDIVLPPRLAVGSPCGVDAGADAGVCPGLAPCAATAPQATTGACTDPPSSGPCLFRMGATVASICALGTTCLRIDPGLPSGECVGPGGKDAPCGAGYNQRTCADGFFCTDPSDKGTCQPLHKLNESCGSTNQCEPALYCNRTGAPLGVCLARPGLGEACGTTFVDGGGALTVPCQEGAGCQGLPNADGGTTSVCVRQGALGAACGAPNEQCYQLLECTSGTCTLPACPADAGPG